MFWSILLFVLATVCVVGGFWAVGFVVGFAEGEDDECS